jgi:acetyl esterase/lipase
MKRGRFGLLGACALAALLAGIPSAQGEQAKDAEPKHEVKVAADLKYYEGEGADAKRHLLDLYLPLTARDFPLVMWIFGGAWAMGDKDQGAPFARALAARGIGVAAVGYRLSPAVQHPAHIEDVARAFAWLHRNVALHGGNPKKLFVAGISAGGHLAALLALDPKYLKAQGLDPDRDVAGAFPVSGVYRLAGEVEWAPRMYTRAFGDDPAVRKDAEPLSHVHAGAPPFYIVHAERDVRPLRAQAEELKKQLENAGGKAFLEEVPGVGHLTIMPRLERPDGDPTAGRLIAFIREAAAARGPARQQGR